MPVAVERQGIEESERGRHHVIRQFVAQEAQKPLDRSALAGPGWHQIGGDPGLPVGPRIGDGRGVRDLRGTAERSLDLIELDPLAIHFDLAVDAPEKFEEPVGTQAHPVAAAIEAGVVATDEGVGDEPFGGEVRPVEVAQRQPVASDVEFTLAAIGNGAQSLVEDMHLGASDRPANGYRPRSAVREA